VSVAGKTAIVTGAATGIGAATAALRAARGARVLAAGLQPEALRESVAAIQVDGRAPQAGAMYGAGPGAR